MELIPVKGNTCILEGLCTIPAYRLNERELILLDSGYANPDRGLLDRLFDREGLRVAAIIGSHTHVDHNGNHAYLQKKHGAEIILPFAEAAIASSPLMGKTAYSCYTPEQIAREFPHLLVRADRVIWPEERTVTVRGRTFDILPLPGHTPGQVGIGTPDGVFYVADAILSREVYLAAKLPTAFSYAEDLASKKALYALRYDKYILAHRGVYDDITGLIGENIAYREERVRMVAELLDAPMTLSALSAAVWERFDMRTKNPFRVSVFERNLHSVMDYLCDRGEAKIQFDGGVMLYERN